MDGFIYIIKPTTCKEDLVKIGRSSNLNLSRLIQYGKNSRVYLTINVYNSKHIEQKIIEELKSRYELEKNEYFIKLKDIIQIFKQNDINIKDNLYIKKIVEDIFEGIEYKERVTINTIQIYKSFTYLKRK